jgi:hypothetical protein
MNLQRQLDAFRRNQMAVQLASKAAEERKALAEQAKRRKEQEAQLKAQQSAALLQAVPVSPHPGRRAGGRWHTARCLRRQRLGGRCVASSAWALTPFPAFP